MYIKYVIPQHIIISYHSYVSRYIDLQQKLLDKYLIPYLIIMLKQHFIIPSAYFRGNVYTDARMKSQKWYKIINQAAFAMLARVPGMSKQLY